MLLQNRTVVALTNAWCTWWEWDPSCWRLPAHDMSSN